MSSANARLHRHQPPKTPNRPFARRDRFLDSLKRLLPPMSGNVTVPTAAVHRCLSRLLNDHETTSPTPRPYPRKNDLVFVNHFSSYCVPIASGQLGGTIIYYKKPLLCTPQILQLTLRCLRPFMLFHLSSFLSLRMLYLLYQFFRFSNTVSVILGLCLLYLVSQVLVCYKLYNILFW